MPYEAALRDSLRWLYAEASGFNVSIDIIVKLAKSLKLDTFIDTDEAPGVKRLSIAGSLLLLEIDFADDDTVSKVSLSLGNHPAGTLCEADFSSRIAQNVVSETSGAGAGTDACLKFVLLSFQTAFRASFLRSSYNGESTSVNDRKNAETILFASLAGPTLGTFPENFKYLADLDRVSPPEGDLIVYIDNLAIYLAAIHETERRLNPDDWQVREGYTSTFGRIFLNDEEGKHVGVFLQYWQEARFIHKEWGKSNSNNALVSMQNARKYKALLAIEETKAPAVDYIVEAKRKPWTLHDSVGGKDTAYYFYGEHDLAHLHGQESVTANAHWRLVLRFTESVCMSETLLEYFGITTYEQAKPVGIDKYWKNAHEEQELRFKNGTRKVSFVFEDSLSLIRLQAVTIGNLHVLSDLMPALRNHIVFTSLVESVALAQNSEYLTASQSDLGKDKEARRKIRDSLQLSSDVPDEELLGLNTISAISTISNDYMGMQMLDPETDLGDFINSESEGSDAFEEEEPADQPQSIPDPELFVSMHEISYGSASSDIVLKLTGTVSSSGSVDTTIRIQNGRIVADTSSDEINMDMGMDMDTGVAPNCSDRFTRSLALSEDILLAMDAMDAAEN